MAKKEKKHYGFGARHIVLLFLLGGGFLSREMTHAIQVVSLRGNLAKYVDPSDTSDVVVRILELTKEQRASNYLLGLLVRPFGSVCGAILTVKYNNKYTLSLQILTFGASLLCLPVILNEFGNIGALTVLCLCGFVRLWYWCSAMSVIGNWTPTFERARSNVMVIAWSTDLQRNYNDFCLAFLIDILGFKFYLIFLSVCAFIWCVLWFVFGSQDPETSFLCTKQEKEFIYENILRLKMPSTKSKIPVTEIIWCPIMYSLSFVMTVLDFVNNIIKDNTIGTGMVPVIAPQFTPPEFRAAVSAALTFAPLVSYMAAFISDKMFERGFTPNTLRKVGNSIGFFGMAICLTFMIYSKTMAAVFFALCFYFISISMACGYMTSIFDIAPSFAGLTYGWLNVPRFIFSIYYDALYNAVVTDKSSLREWTQYIFIAIFLLYTSNLAFLMSGTIHTIPFTHLNEMLWKPVKIPSYPNVEVKTKFDKHDEEQ